MAEIKVPKPPKRAFNPKRPASDLLRHQIEHLEWAIRHAGQRRAGYSVKPVQTEADAAARMAGLIPQLSSAARLPFTAAGIPTPTTDRKRATRRQVAKRKTAKARLKRSGKATLKR